MHLNEYYSENELTNESSQPLSKKRKKKRYAHWNHLRTGRSICPHLLHTNTRRGEKQQASFSTQTYTQLVCLANWPTGHFSLSLLFSVYSWIINIRAFCSCSTGHDVGGCRFSRPIWIFFWEKKRSSSHVSWHCLLWRRRGSPSSLPLFAHAFSHR